jgi:Spy/CpxP family protein refolding chaperone
MSSQILKPWVVLALIFLAGTATGSLLTVGLGPRFFPPPPVGIPGMKQHWMTHLTKRLDLTADQQAKIEPIVANAVDKLQALHHDEMDQAAQIMESVNKQITPLLTPDQKTKLQRLESEHQENEGHPHLHPHPGASNEDEPGGAPPPPQS